MKTKECIKNYRVYFSVLFCFYMSFLYASEINKERFQSKYYKENKVKVYGQIKLLEDSCIDVFLKSLPSQSKAIYFVQYGKLLYKRKQLNNSQLYLRKSIELFNNQKIEEGEADGYFYLGKICALQGKADSTLGYFTTAGAIYERLNNFRNACTSYMEIANYFSKHGNKASADIYYGKSQSLLERFSDQNIKELVVFNAANHANYYHEYDLALNTYLDLLENTSKTKNIKRNGYILNNIGVIYLLKNDWNIAKEYLENSLSIRTILNDTVGIKSTLINLFRVAIVSKNINDAVLLRDSLNKYYINERLSLEEQVLFSFNKIEYYSLMGKADLMGKELGIYTRLKDSLSNIAFSDKLIEMQKSFEIQERDKNIALLQKEDELKEARLNNQFIVIVSISLVVLVLIVLGYFINRQRLKLKKSECELKKQQDRIQAMNDNLDLSNQAKDRILSIIGHDLRGPIGGLKELIDLYVDLPTYEEEDFKSLIKAAREASTGSYHLLENLLTWANSQRGQINFMPVNAPLYPLVKQCVDLLDSSINTRHVGFKFDIHPNLKLTADLNMIRTVVRNLVSNAVKYSPPESCVTISAVQNNVETLISITDSGYGMSADQAEVLFTQKETYYIEAGYNAKGTGLGLILCREFVERHNGRIWADSKTNKGTQVCFTIPRNIKEESSNVPSHKNSAVLN